MTASDLGDDRSRSAICRVSATQTTITAAVLASADHDLQIRRRPNANYGEAVGITPIYETSRDALASLAPQHREIRLFGQFKWDYGRSDDRSGSGNLRQQALVHSSGRRLGQKADELLYVGILRELGAHRSERLAARHRRSKENAECLGEGAARAIGHA